jgi:NAD(P)H-quinone oxidoreductase subunit 4
MVAYSSIGHMGYVLWRRRRRPPSASLAPSCRWSATVDFRLTVLLVGVVYAKTGTRDLTVLRGLLNPARGFPIVAV